MLQTNSLTTKGIFEKVRPVYKTIRCWCKYTLEYAPNIAAFAQFS